MCFYGRFPKDFIYIFIYNVFGVRACFCWEMNKGAITIWTYYIFIIFSEMGLKQVYFPIKKFKQFFQRFMKCWRGSCRLIIWGNYKFSVPVMLYWFVDYFCLLLWPLAWWILLQLVQHKCFWGSLFHIGIPWQTADCCCRLLF